MGIGLVLLTDGAPVNIFANILSKAWPPEFCSDKLAGFEIPWVSCHFVVMTTLDNGASKRSIQRNVNSSLVGKDAFRDLPVGQAGSEGSGDGQLQR